MPTDGPTYRAPPDTAELEAQLRAARADLATRADEVARLEQMLAVQRAPAAPAQVPPEAVRAWQRAARFAIAAMGSAFVASVCAVVAHANALERHTGLFFRRRVEEAVVATGGALLLTALWCGLCVAPFALRSHARAAVIGHVRAVVSAVGALVALACALVALLAVAYEGSGSNFLAASGPPRIANAVTAAMSALTAVLLFIAEISLGLAGVALLRGPARPQ